MLSATNQSVAAEACENMLCSTKGHNLWQGRYTMRKRGIWRIWSPSFPLLLFQNIYWRCLYESACEWAVCSSVLSVSPSEQAWTAHPTSTLPSRWQESGSVMDQREPKASTMPDCPRTIQCKSQPYGSYHLSPPTDAWVLFVGCELGVNVFRRDETTQILREKNDGSQP